MQLQANTAAVMNSLMSQSESAAAAVKKAPAVQNTSVAAMNALARSVDMPETRRTPLNVGDLQLQFITEGAKIMQAKFAPMKELEEERNTLAATLKSLGVTP
jgi:hypothetical protein